MFRKTYKLSRDKYTGTITYAEVRFKHILYVKCVEENRDPSVFGANIWKVVGGKHYAWVLANDTLDVNAPVHKRYDLYVCNSAELLPVLLASVFEDGDTYHCYQYNAVDEVLSFLSDADTLEGAKATLEILSVVEE